MTPREEIGYGLDALVIFRNLIKDPLFCALHAFCHTNTTDTAAQIRLYSAMTAALYAQEDDLTAYVTRMVLEDENGYVQRVGARQPISANLEACLHTELKLLGRIAMLSPAQMQAEMQTTIPLPQWKTRQIDLDACYRKRIAEIDRHGYGIYARHAMFTLDDAGELIPVQYPDPISLQNLIGYERERNIVIENTKALLHGKYASNVLLSGDAGTGKSATIKAIANAYRDDGLRLIELNKNQLCFLPRLMDRLCKNPLKYILYLDDLTFSEDDPNFGTLKATLEGSISARVKNTVIYATSNRRHLVKETFDDSSDKHKNDTIQERISLSERFGITITYSRPEKDLYLEIVHTLAAQVGLQISTAELDEKAERFALQKSGRSARAARQFVDQLQAVTNL